MQEKEVADLKLLSNQKLDAAFAVFTKKDNEMRMEYLNKNHQANLPKSKLKNACLRF